MNNYLEEIENEYSRARGKQSLLAPIDWQLAQSWEYKNIPIRIVLRAMREVVKNFEAQKRKGTINTLRYFEQEIEKQFAEWLSSQVGKNIEENDMNNQSFAESVAYSEDYAEYIETTLVAGFDLQISVPDLLRSALIIVRASLLILTEDIKRKQLNIDDIEARLKAIAADFDISLVASFTDAERAQIIKQTKAEYAKITVTDEVLQKILIRRLYQKFCLPELTLFAL